MSEAHEADMICTVYTKTSDTLLLNNVKFLQLNPMHVVFNFLAGCLILCNFQDKTCTVTLIWFQSKPRICMTATAFYTEHVGPVPSRCQMSDHFAWLRPVSPAYCIKEQVHSYFFFYYFCNGVIVKIKGWNRKQFFCIWTRYLYLHFEAI